MCALFTMVRVVGSLSVSLVYRYANIMPLALVFPVWTPGCMSMTGVQTDVPQVLAAEEQGAGLQQPTGIGQRPRPMSSEEGPQASVKNYRNSPQLPINDKYM